MPESTRTTGNRREPLAVGDGGTGGDFSPSTLTKVPPRSGGGGTNMMRGWTRMMIPLLVLPSTVSLIESALAAQTSSSATRARAGAAAAATATTAGTTVSSVLGGGDVGNPEDSRGGLGSAGVLGALVDGRGEMEEEDEESLDVYSDHDSDSEDSGDRLEGTGGGGYLPELRRDDHDVATADVEGNGEGRKPADDFDVDDVIVVSSVAGDIIGLSRRTGTTLWRHEGGGSRRSSRCRNSSSSPSCATSSKSRMEIERQKMTNGGRGGCLPTVDDDDDSSSGKYDPGDGEGVGGLDRGDDACAPPLEDSPTMDRLLAPLVSTTTTTKSSTSGLHTAAVPSIDGRIYLTPGRRRDMSSSASPSTSPDGTTETASIRELVDRSPFVDPNGKFYVGTRRSTAAALDRDTGEVLRLVRGEEEQDSEGGGDDSEEGANVKRRRPSLEGRNVVWIGRVDNSVTVYDARTGEVDVQFSASEILSIGDMIGAYVLPDNTATDPSPPFMDGSSISATPARQSVLLSTPGGHLGMRDPRNGGLVAWVSDESFDAPIAFAVGAQSGASLGVDIVPDAPVPSSSRAYLTEQFERQLSLMGEWSGHGGATSSDIGDVGESIGKTIVGSLATGQLFALPLGRSTSAAQPMQKVSQARSGLQRQYSHPAAIGSNPGRQQMKISPVGRGHHQLTEFSQHATQYVSDQQKLVSARQCLPSSRSYPACLVGLRDNVAIPARKLGVDDYSAEGRFSSEHAGALDNDRRHSGTRSWFRFLLRIMASWVPPAVALAFVLSFEVGRRERLKAEIASLNNEDDAVSRNHKSGGTELSNEEEEEFSSTAVDLAPPLIKVSDEVLGYGGHGTIVYKGKLEGRNVAVKRMLKAYHASADREISLLIESDGHPNVVRYFLKEVRGDFIYLAVELCDCSLHDLIFGQCRQAQVTGKAAKLEQANHASAANAEVSAVCVLDSSGHAVSPSTQKALFQIASGVRHLHSLRIVHRDLKPQNILLALRNCDDENSIIRSRSSQKDAKWQSAVCSAFDRDEFVPKISDMGLGKQLAGQSSFGMSTLGNVSADAGDCSGSTNNVAGPGSVGWQAPEVMALRWSTEEPVTFATDSNGTESMSQSSPVALAKRTSRAVDIFSLGCIFYCTLLPGSHPFGEWYEREANIMKDKSSIQDLEKISIEAFDLVKAMIARDAKLRPTAAQVCNHPFFWKPSKRLAFLSELSDRLEAECTGDSSSDGCFRGPISNEIAFKIEKNAAKVIGLAWDKDLDPDLISNVSRFRTYDPSSVRDCLRIIRNKYHHYDELPLDVKRRIGGTSLDDLLRYFQCKFPRLLMHCYSFCREVLSNEDPFAIKYGISCGSNCGEPQSVVEPRPMDVPKLVAESSQMLVQDTPTESMVTTGEEPSNAPSAGGSIMHEVSRPVLDTSEECKRNAVVSESNDAPRDLSDAGVSKLKGEQTSVVDVSSLSSSVRHGQSEVDMVVWEGSNVAKLTNCRGWMRSEDEWIRRTDAVLRKRDANVTRCADDPKFRTRLCNHWDVSKGTHCPMRKKNKCVFAHGPVELRVKEGKRHRWGSLVDEDGNNSNPCHSGGEDTYGAARSIETMRKEEGKWKTHKAPARGKNKQRKKK